MICPKCKNDGILNQANGKDFYFCKTCREEIILEEVQPSADITQEEIDAIFNDFYWTNSGNYAKQYTTLEEHEQSCLSISPHWSDK